MNHTPDRGATAVAPPGTAEPGAAPPRRRFTDTPRLSPRRRLFLECAVLGLMLPLVMLALARWTPLWQADALLTDQAVAQWPGAAGVPPPPVQRLALETACAAPLQACALDLDNLQTVLTQVLAQQPELVLVDAGHLAPEDARALQSWLRLRPNPQAVPVFVFANALQVPLDLMTSPDGLVRALRTWRQTPEGALAHPVLAALKLDSHLTRWPTQVLLGWQPTQLSTPGIGPQLAGQRVVIGAREATASRPALLIGSQGVVHVVSPMEALAQAMERLASDHWLRPVPTALLVLWLALPLWLALAAVLRWPDQAGRVVAGVALGSVLAWGGLWWLGRWALPPLALVLGFGLLLLLWRWRRSAMIRATLTRRVGRLRQLLPQALDQIDPRDPAGHHAADTEIVGHAPTSARTLIDTMDGLLDSLEAHLQIQRRVRLQRDRWLAFLSHDLRSPQSNILSLLELHERGVGSMDNERLYQGVRRQVDRTLHLAEGVVDLLRADADQLQLRHCALNELAADAIERCWPQAQAGQVRLRLRSDELVDAPVVADAELLTRVLVNLLSNAIRHSPQGSQVDVCVALDSAERQVVCAVRDEGAGMPEAQIERLVLALDPGGLGRASAPGSGPRKGHGLGLGLLVAHTVVTRHGGHLTAWSASEQGTTFVLTLPAGVTQPRMAPPGRMQRETQAA